MKAPLCKTALLILGLLLAQTASANLVTDGTFNSITYSDNATKPITGQLYGQFGSDSTAGIATGSTLTVAGWDTSGYNFVYTSGTISAGTSANGSSAQPFEAPGEYNVTAAGASQGYGNTYMWGQGNSGKSTITTPPGGGNIVAADGIYQVGAITQTINGLLVGHVYSVSFWWGGAEQQSFNSITTESWTVALGAQSNTTTTITNAAESFTGWKFQTFYFTATAASEVLSFTATGTPGCEPPFALLADVDMELVPDVSNWMIFTGFGALCIGFQIVRRRRRRIELLPAV